MASSRSWVAWVGVRVVRALAEAGIAVVGPSVANRQSSGRIATSRIARSRDRANSVETDPAMLLGHRERELRAAARHALALLALRANRGPCFEIRGERIGIAFVACQCLGGGRAQRYRAVVSAETLRGADRTTLGIAFERFGLEVELTGDLGKIGIDPAQGRHAGCLAAEHELQRL